MARADLLRALAGVAVSALAGCSFAPTLKVPEVPVAQSYKEEAPWTPAEPADRIKRDAWWTQYGDKELDDLQGRLIAGSADLAAALARYQQAQAVSDQLHSGLFPTLAGIASSERDRQSEAMPLRVLGPNSPNNYGQYNLGAQLDYEVDLWGRVRNQVASGNASARAAQADLESARLSLQAQLADNYIVLRGLDRQIALLRDTVTAYEKALDLTQARHAGGIASGLDVARAQTQIESARSQLSQTLAQRALTEHAIAALIGESASSFALAPRTDELNLVRAPVGMPSTLLQRRPDIAAAQRRVEAANANIGVTRAAFFPAITLSAAAGFQSGQSSNWLKAPNSYWSIGPSLLLTLFDAGKRKAEVAQAQAALDEQGASYRGVVLTAFQQVEDNLALLHHYADADDADKAAVKAAQSAVDLSTSRYREGAVNYLDVVTAQTTALQIQSEKLDLDTRQLRASVALIRALGGGWSADAPVAEIDTAAHARQGELAR
jgi:NodT family efflux transporter outer membrane factor (OMF) lipoprotein